MFNLRALLEQVKNGQYVGIDQMTVPTIRKTMDVVGDDGKVRREANPHYGHITKVVAGSRCFIGASYESMVRRRMKAEGIEMPEGEKFEAEKLPWGEYVSGGFPVISHKGKFYLRLIFENPGQTQYLLDGKPIDKEDIIGLSESKSSDAGQGGIENKVIIRTIGLESIVKIRAISQELKGPFSWS